MTKSEFKNLYAIQFVASYKAVHYAEDCVYGRHDEIRNHGLFEDAFDLAEDAWESFKEFSEEASST